MAVGNEQFSSNSVSFKFASKTTKKVGTTSKAFSSEVKLKDDTEDKDYISLAEGKELLSKKTKKVTGKLVIPLITTNNWRVSGKDKDDLEKQAAQEIIKDLENERKNEEEKTVMPILMSNRLPLNNGEVGDEKYDISIRPDQSSMEDYDNIPITSFGEAMLRGMGWSEGKPIGLNNKGLCEPIEFIPRHKGLGLGAEKRMDEKKKRRIKKLGEVAVDENRYQPIIEKDGRVRHVKGLDEKVRSVVKGFCPGLFIQVMKGPHKDLYGKIVSVNEDSARLSVKLTISGEIIELSQHYSNLIDEDEYKHYLGKKKTAHVTDHEPISKKIKYTKSDNLPTICWMSPNIRVRIVSKHYGGGKYYNKKVKLLDVITADTCSCQTDEKKLLEDIRQSDIETIIPKSIGSHVLVVGGKYKGEFGSLVERNRKKCEAVIQLSTNKHLTNISYDNICEYVGELPDDMLL